MAYWEVITYGKDDAQHSEFFKEERHAMAYKFFQISKGRISLMFHRASDGNRIKFVDY